MYICIDTCEIEIFAGDTTIYFYHSLFKVIQEELQNDLNAISNWCYINRLVTVLIHLRIN